MNLIHGLRERRFAPAGVPTSKSYKLRAVDFMFPCFLLLASVPSARIAASKPPIDISAYDQWAEIGEVELSHDGRFALYGVQSVTPNHQSLVLQATDGSWRHEVLLEPKGIASAHFTADSRYAAFMTADGRLGISTLGTDAIEFVPRITGFTLPRDGHSPWLAYSLSDRAVVLRNVAARTETIYTAIDDYLLGRDGRVLILKSSSDSASGRSPSLDWVDVLRGRRHRFWSGRAGESVSLDKAHFGLDASQKHVAFIVDKEGTAPERTLWYYEASGAHAQLLSDDAAALRQTGLKIGSIQGFGRDARALSMTFEAEKKAPPTRAHPDAVPVSIWSYNDDKLQSEQRHDENDDGRTDYAVVLEPDRRRFVRLEQSPFERVTFPRLGESHRADDPFLTRPDDQFLTHIGLLRTERPLNLAERRGREWQWDGLSYSLIRTGVGSRTALPRLNDIDYAVLSPAGKYVLYFDPKESNFFAYDVASGVTRDLTHGLDAQWGAVSERPRDLRTPVGVAGWTRGDGSVLLYERHDLWQVDPTGRKPALNVTNGYGRKNDVMFEIALENQGTYIDGRTPITFIAFDRGTKDQGFFSKSLADPGDPRRLTMGPYLYHALSSVEAEARGDFPIRARDAAMYVVTRQSAAESPNYFTTRDFEIFTRLSDVAPERNYNWLTSELHSWIGADGALGRGILYKPEDFDLRKSYPAIVFYYNTLTNDLNAYQKAGWLMGGGDAGCSVNIPDYVSSGYLVFMPDVHYPPGNPSLAVGSTISAAQYLSTLSWVDAKRMGAMGCSWGGMQTGMIVSRSKLFAAAVSASGIYDALSMYGGLEGDGRSRQGFFENGDWHMGTPWTNSIAFVESSSVLSADHITTPLLLIGSPNDHVAPFSQAVEMFTALRRLGKKAWLLEYSGPYDGHFAVGMSGQDLSIRMRQFFGYYLKGEPPPRWMTDGVPARLKGIETGLELDVTGKLP